MIERIKKLAEKLNTISFPADINGALKVSTVKTAADDMGKILVMDASIEEKLKKLTEIGAMIDFSSELCGKNHEAVRILHAIHAIIKASLEGRPEPTDEELGLAAKCFIATACYGTADCSEVIRLRRFRDEVIMRSSAGRFLVDCYYRVSPSLAKWILNKPKCKLFVKKCLIEPLVNRLPGIR